MSTYSARDRSAGFSVHAFVNTDCGRHPKSVVNQDGCAVKFYTFYPFENMANNRNPRFP